MDALALCEAGEWEGIRQLREWHEGRLRLTLERMLGDEASAAQALEAALDDIWRHAGAHRAMGIDAEDWLFGRLRQVAQSWRSGSPAPARLRPVPAAAVPIQPAPPSPSPSETTYAVAGLDPGSPELVNSRLRPASAPVQSRPTSRVEATPYRSRGGLAWLRLVLLWLLAGTLGFGLAVAGLLWLTGTAPFPAGFQPGVTDQPAAVTVRPPAVGTDTGGPESGPASPSARDLLGPPLAAPEPSADVAPEALPVSPEQPGTRPVPPAIPVTSTRIVIHFGGDADSREVAQRLADQLRRADYGTVEIKMAPFEIGSASVRFFHAEDRLAAQQLVNALGPFLVWQGRAAPTAPIDFTDYRPLPGPGALEIWLPRR